MKKLLLVGVAIAGIASAAATSHAQNGLPWSGPEVGVQAGYGWGSSSGNFIDNNLKLLNHFSFNPDGFVGGIHGGWDWELHNHVVLGIEGFLDGSTVSGSVSNPTGFHAKNTLNYEGTINGRLGYAFDRVMLYGTGGFAYGDVDASYRDRLTVGRVVTTDTLSRQDVRVGWTAGAGVAYKITRHWEGDLSYRYIDLGSDTFNHGGMTAQSNHLSYNILSVGLTYRFTPPPPPPPMAAPMPAAAPAPVPAPARTFLVFFRFDRYDLTPEARRTLEAAVFTFRKSGGARIEVSGYTDLAGTQAYNLRLSRRRADAVAAYLARHGVPRRVMDVKWFGKEHPRVPTPDGVREPQNRRVEIVMP